MSTARCEAQKPDGTQCKFPGIKDGLCHKHKNYTGVRMTASDDVPNENIKETPKMANKDAEKYNIAAERRKKRKQDMKRTGAFDGQQLYAEQKQGWYRRWVNDTNNRIANLESLGYTFVEGDSGAESQDIGSRVSRRVGSDKVGNPVYAYLMELPMDMREEDMAAKEQKIRRTEKDIRSATLGDGVGVDGSAYLPDRFKNNAFSET